MQKEKMTPVSSSNIDALGYDKKEKVAYVLFKNGLMYSYYNVHEDDYKELLEAPSIGSFLNRVFKNAHRAERVS